MKIRYNNILPLSLTATILWLSAACTNDDTSGKSVENQKEVSIMFSTAAVGKPVITRSDASDTHNDALTAGQNIGVYIYGYEGSTGYDISQYQPSAGTTSKTWVYQTVGDAVTVTGGTKESNLVLTSHATAPKFPSKVSGNGDMDRVEIFAIYPNNPDVTPSTTSYKLTVDLDQTDTDKIKAADLMTNDKTSYNKDDCDGKNLKLKLKHRMAKLHVTFVPKTGSDLTSANMPTIFKVIGVRRTVTINPKAGTVVRDDTQAATTESTPLLGSASQSFFLPPQPLAASTLLKFDIKGSALFKGIANCTFAPSSAVTLEAGKSYEITVTVDVDYATATGTITSWNEETLNYDTVVL